MTPHKKQRLIVLALSLFSMGLGAALLLFCFRDNLVYFYGPSEIPAHLKPQQLIRIGGLVVKGSLNYHNHEQRVYFHVTDFQAEIPVEYNGALPDLFREGQGVVVEGVMQKGVLKARQVLAKHDENYRPPTSQRALDKSGRQKMEQSLKKE